MRTLQLILLPLFGLLMGCGALKSSSSKDSFSLELTHWQLESIGSKSVKANGDSYTMRFGDDGKINAKGACNILFGPYNATTDGTLNFGGLASTRMACPGMDVEAKYMEALGKTTSYKVDDDMLILMDEQETLMRFKRIE